MLSAEKLLQLRRFELLLPRVEVRNEIVSDALALLGPLDERRDLFVADVQLVDEIEVGLQSATLARQLLAFGWIGPDTRLCELTFYLLKRFSKRGFVKDNVARRGCDV